MAEAICGSHIFRHSDLRISEIFISDIQNNYSGYQKLCQKGVLFEIPKKVIFNIQNNNFVYPKINIYFGYQKLLFWISEIVISEHLEFFFRYLKLMCQYFRYHKFFFGYPE